MKKIIMLSLMWIFVLIITAINVNAVITLQDSGLSVNNTKNVSMESGVTIIVQANLTGTGNGNAGGEFGIQDDGNGIGTSSCTTGAADFECDADSYAVTSGNIATTDNDNCSLTFSGLGSGESIQANFTIRACAGVESLPSSNTISLYSSGVVNAFDLDVNITINPDTTKPRINASLNNSAPFYGSIVNMTANVTDETALDTCQFFMNGTSDGSYIILNKTVTGTNDQCSQNFTIGLTRGAVINFTTLVNDTSNNQNQSINRSDGGAYIIGQIITIANAPAPQATIVFPTNDLKTNDQSLDFNVTFTPDPDGDVINISYYINGVLNQTNLTNTTFEASDGVYILNVSLHDNVTTIEYSANVSVNFTIDTTKPNTNLISPGNYFNSSYDNITFNFNVTDERSTADINCSILLNTNINKTNTSVLNGTHTSFILYNITEGWYTWNVTCLDEAGNSNTSGARNFSVDLTTPSINKISFWPNSTDGVDQDVLLNFTVNVTDDVSGVKKVVLQYKQSGAGSFTGSTMQYNSGSGLYNASFTPDIDGMWNYRINVSDYAGNNISSDITNISVEDDYAWTRTPSTFDTSSCVFSTTCVVGNITINNTGDFTFNFDLSSNFGDTSYNITEPFDVAAGNYEVVEVSLTAGATASESNVVITTDATTANADPDTDTTNLTFIASAGGPVFDLIITDYPVEVNRSAGEGFHLNASLKNIGNETAGTTWVNWTLPANWLNISGTNLTKNISNLSVNEIVHHNITVNLTSTATTGTKTINVTAASNNSASDSAAASIVVTETSTTTTTTTTTATGGGGGGAGAGGGGGGSLVSVPVKPEEIEISQTVDLVRGEDNTFTIEVENTFEDSVLKDLTLEVEGFLSQYLTITPKIIPSLGYKKSKIFTVTVAAPAYKGYEEHTLKATVTGTLVKTTKTQNVTITSRNPFTLRNYISLIIHEVGEEETNASLEGAAKLIEEMKQAGFPVKKSLKLLEEAEEKLGIGRYQLAKDIADKINKIRDDAFSASSLMQEVKIKIQEAENKGLQVEETKRLLNLAVAAFEREDFLTAIQRAKDAQLSIVIETKGKINVVKFIIDYWYPIVIALLILLSISYFLRKQLILIIISRRLKDLQKEEVTINELMQETQEKFYKEKKMTTTEYHKAMYGYEKRLGEISQLISRLRSKRVGIIEISNEIKNLKKDDENIVNLIKQLQDGYYNKQTITRKIYSKRMEEHKLRRIEIERSIAVLEAKLAKKEKLEELKAKESPEEKVKRLRKKEEGFKKAPHILSGIRKIFDVHKSRDFIAKSIKKFSFKNLFKDTKEKDHAGHVKQLVDELVRKDDKPVLSTKPMIIKPTTIKPVTIKKIRIRLPSIKGILIKQIIQKFTETIKKLSLKDSILELKGKIRRRPAYKPASRKKEIISKLKDKFRLDMSEISKIRGNRRFPVSPENQKNFHEISEHAQKLKVFDRIKIKRVKDYTADRDVLEEHGFKIKPRAFSKSDATKHNILKHLKEVHSK